MKSKLFLGLIILSLNVYSQFQASVSTVSKELLLDTIYGSDSTAYTSVSFEDMWYSSEVGNPRIPVKYVKYVIPENVEISGFTINEGTATVLNGTYYLYPAQEDVPMYITPEFAFPDSVAYRSSLPYPGTFGEIVADEYYMGYHIVTLQIYPLQYIPLI